MPRTTKEKLPVLHLDACTPKEGLEIEIQGNKPYLFKDKTKSIAYGIFLAYVNQKEDVGAFSSDDVRKAIHVIKQDSSVVPHRIVVSIDEQRVPNLMKGNKRA